MTDGRGGDGFSDLTMTVRGDSLAGFVGPAVILDASGAVLAANARAGGLALGPASVDGLAETIDRVAETGDVHVGFVELRRAKGRQALEVTLIPLTDGRMLVLGNDVTLDENLRAALVESRQRYKDFVEISSDFAWETNGQGLLVFVSPRGALGYPAEHLVGRDPRDLLIVRPGDAVFSPFETDFQVEDVEIWMRSARGTDACLLASAAPLLGSEGEWRGARGVCRDITALRERDTALARARNHERLVTYIVRAFRDEVDPDNMLTVAAGALMTGFGADGCQIYRTGTSDDSPELAGVAILAASVGREPPEPTVAALLAGLATGPGQVESAADGLISLAEPTRFRQDVNGAVCLWRGDARGPWSEDDKGLFTHLAIQVGIANEQLANHRRILTLSRTDALTGLFNRRAFFAELERRFLRLERGGGPAALIFVDLDNFKAVNDAHGHHTGDLALLKARDILVGHTRPTDLVARVGGDEFAIWLEGADTAIAEGRASHLVAEGDSLAAFSGSPDAPFTISLGIAVYDPARPEPMETLVQRADKALSAAKRAGKATYRIAQPAVSVEPADDR